LLQDEQRPRIGVLSWATDSDANQHGFLPSQGKCSSSNFSIPGKISLSDGFFMREMSHYPVALQQTFCGKMHCITAVLVELFDSNTVILSLKQPEGTIMQSNL